MAVWDLWSMLADSVVFMADSNAHVVLCEVEFSNSMLVVVMVEWDNTATMCVIVKDGVSTESMGEFRAQVVLKYVNVEWPSCSMQVVGND
jgi:hypothetical protein